MIYPHGKGTKRTINVDYVFVLGNLDSRTDSCTLLVKKNIEDYYVSLPTNSDLMKLYKLK